MTVAPSEPGGLPATEDDLDTGLEDFNLSDAVIPRLTIKHQEGFFLDSLSNREFNEIEAIVLGMVRQRVLWHTSMDDDDAAPMCKSQDYTSGWPIMSEEQPKNKRFPWELSKFNPDDFPPDEDGQIQLPCERCYLKEWGSHPDGKKPYCSEQFTMPLLYREFGSTDDPFVIAVISFQKTSLKPLKAYLSNFKRDNSPTYTVTTKISLDQLTRGGNKYCVANFRLIEKTNSDDWRGYSNNYRNLRSFLMAPPLPRDEEETPSDSENVARPPADQPAPETEPVVASEPKASADQTVPQAESSATSPPAEQKPPPPDDDEDLPF